MSYQVFSTIVQLVPLAPASDLRALRHRQPSNTSASSNSNTSTVSNTNVNDDDPTKDIHEQQLIHLRSENHQRLKEMHQQEVLAHLVLGDPLPLQYSSPDLDACLQPHVRCNEKILTFFNVLVWRVNKHIIIAAFLTNRQIAYCFPLQMPSYYYLRKKCMNLISWLPC